MRRSGAVLALLAAILLAAPADDADAFKYRMRYGQAKNASKQYAKETCNELADCIAWGVGKCTRRSVSGFDCLVGFFFPGAESGEEIECQQMLHWGVGPGGYIRLKGSSKPQCFAV